VPLEDVPEAPARRRWARALSFGDLGDLPPDPVHERTSFPRTSSACTSSTADRKSFVFSPGPLFANVVLADEINRSNPRAQSALLRGDERAGR